ncbi:uncharacterized protein LOC143265171 [Megachile rotundata]|uniref:uncharacterized protein LOC143265171 n=1 Tax=Megachile rotundata TaxID=143995 RepID=UPI003FD41119
MDEFKSLVVERGSIKAALTRLQKFFKDNAGVTTVGSLRKRLAANIVLYEKFNSVQTRIEILVANSEAAASHAAERETFETSYFDLVDAIETHIAKLEGPQRAEANISPVACSAISGAAINVRLPTIQLPSFDGNYSHWLRFRDSFISLVHQNETLSDVQRFHYLNSSLKGAVSRVIHSLGVSEANYKLAWQLLNSRYENSTALKRHHVTALLDLVPIQKQSEGALREFLDDATNHRIALKALGESVDSWDTLIIPLLSRKLDSVSVREWERRISSQSQMPTFTQFSEFLEERAKYLGNISTNAQQVPTQRFDQRTRAAGNQRVNPVSSHIVNTGACPVCKGIHAIYHCDKFKSLEPLKKTKIVQEAQVCYNCLQSGHRVKACTRSQCRICGRKHHSLLHRDDIHTVKPTNPTGSVTTEVEPTEPQPLVSHVSSKPQTYTILSTAIVYVTDYKGQSHKCRVLLDSGSQANFITSEFCNRIGIRPKLVESTVTGLGKAINSIKGKANIRIQSRYNKYQVSLDCLLIDQITTNMPNFSLTQEKVEIPKHIELADPNFHIPQPIDMLIGASLFWSLLCVGQHTCRSGIVCQKTQLGWIIGGTFSWADRESQGAKACHLITQVDLQSQLEKFWSIEEIGPGETKFIDDCELHFQQTTRQDIDGRYIVSIPFKENINQLGDSRQQAERRLYALERKLVRNPQLKQKYVEFLKEYETLGHMTPIVQSSETTQLQYYLPHHAVTKIDSTTTKVRVVFDGSAKSSSGLSLNDTQLIGPTVQNDLMSILIRFRYHKYVISADIEKMYRQVLIEPSQRKFQKILWRSDPQSPIQEFELNTITYGTASTPFLATRVLREIGLKCADSFPEISRIIINDFYVDDLLTGAQTSTELNKLKSDITKILLQSGMHLRKWATNCPEIESIIHNNQEIVIEKDPKTLGLLWSPKTDQLNFRIKFNDSSRITKRVILSEIAQLFDPLGLLGPLIVTAKLILQRLWQIQAGWDESISQDLRTQWLQYRDDIAQIQTIRIPRCTISNRLDTNIKIELHGFSDASERAYRACVYLRSRDTAGQWTTALLCAKSRVAPLKAVSLPRLELCGALLLAQLVKKIRIALSLVELIEHLWTDSTITLAWLRSTPTRWKTFVANRVSEIQSVTSVDSWKHVASGDNPADMISRGVRLSVLAQSKIWWSGPAWLSKDVESWPISTEVHVAPILEERIIKNALAVFTNEKLSIFEKFSNYTRLVRVTAYIFRFTRNSQLKCRNNQAMVLRSGSEPLTTTELDQARIRLERLAQQEAFPHEIAALESGQPISKSSSLRSLNAFLDSKGVIRVGGRLANAPIPYDTKYPVILPAKHPFTELVIRYEHIRLLHAGNQAVLASLRTRYWPLSCRNNVRRIIRNCIRCVRANPVSETHQMGQLPAARVTPSRPFFTCGVDYAGPFYTKERTRSKVSVKAYLCIFVCFVTKAVHLELATDLSTNAFIQCLRRFIARRGRCRCIVSDNGTNFVGARNELAELGALIKDKRHNKLISDTLNLDGIEWKLIPPHAPHFGGLWERAVRSAKHHVKRVIGDQRLTFEELYTLLTQVESCLNSRPLSPMSSDPTDFGPLTPGHFLIGTAPTSLPDRNLEDVKTNRLNRFQLLQQMFQHFWRRWQAECIHEMQQRYKWRSITKQIIIGALVIIKEENTPPLHWSLGRVVEVHPGQDGIIRVATVRTAAGIIKRPVTKLCLLPIDPIADSPTNPVI